MRQGVQVYRQISEVVQRPGRQEIIDVRQRCLQSSGQRSVVGGPDERVEPDEPVAAPLEPGDLLFTGTPAGVGELKNGDEVVVEIEGLGVLKNPVRKE